MNTNLLQHTNVCSKRHFVFKKKEKNSCFRFLRQRVAPGTKCISHITGSAPAILSWHQRRSRRCHSRFMGECMVILYWESRDTVHEGTAHWNRTSIRSNTGRRYRWSDSKEERMMNGEKRRMEKKLPTLSHWLFYITSTSRLQQNYTSLSFIPLVWWSLNVSLITIFHSIQKCSKVHKLCDWARHFFLVVQLHKSCKSHFDN